MHQLLLTSLSLQAEERLPRSRPCAGRVCYLEPHLPRVAAQLHLRAQAPDLLPLLGPGPALHNVTSVLWAVCLWDKDVGR